MEILCFFAGVLFCYTHNLFICLILCAVLLIKPRLKLIIFFLIALIWGLMHESLYKTQRLGDNLDNQVVSVTGLISTVPTTSNRKTKFYLRSSDFGMLLVSCYRDCERLELNQVITADVKLRKPRNFNNPGGFDYVSFLRARHVYWLASIKKFSVISQQKHYNWLLYTRHNIGEHINKLKLDKQTLGILKALTIGITDGLDTHDWLLFRNTGTIHLLVISGAHIGFITSLIFLLIKLIWSRIGNLALVVSSNQVASVLALLIAVIYGGLAGFSVSVQRALIACGFLLSRNFLPVKFSNWQAWRSAIIVTLLLEPHSVLLPGFYLSFIAVAVLLLGNKFFAFSGMAKGLVLQACCLIWLMPFTLYWFSYGSINSFIANLVAIPLVGFIIVPLCLVYLSLSWLPDYSVLGFLLDNLVRLLYFYLHFVESSLPINFTQYLSIYTLLSILLIFICILSYTGRGFRVTFISLLFVLYFPKNTKVPFANAKIDILDVGQGLAVIIRTAKHIAIYDTGGKFYLGKDMGEMVIIPYLRTLGIKRLDKVIISHPDLDHRGGLPSLSNAYKIDQLIVNNPKYYHQGYGCHDYPSWEWEGVKFEFLAIAKHIRKRNNDSCVLLVKSPQHSILLTGDIESGAEKYLLENHAKNLRADFLLVPHHGSKTSSSRDFISMVRPQAAFISYGLNNRYHFPHLKVTELYNMLNIPLSSTAKYGMISIDLSSGVVH